MPEEVGRLVAGLWCGDVLGDLSAYVDGELEPAVVERVEAHLRGCDWCEQFGGRFGGIVSGLRAGLAEAEPLEAGVAERLLRRLRSVSAGEG